MEIKFQKALNNTCILAYKIRKRIVSAYYDFVVFYFKCDFHARKGGKKLIIVEDFFYIEKNKERLLFEWKDSEENCII